jgi:hypothetical protein
MVTFLPDIFAVSAKLSHAFAASALAKVQLPPPPPLT